MQVRDAILNGRFNTSQTSELTQIVKQEVEKRKFIVSDFSKFDYLKVHLNGWHVILLTFINILFTCGIIYFCIVNDWESE